MLDKTSEDQAKVDAYLDIVEERILEPIRTTVLKNYCTVTLLPLFAAINGLGTLLHPNDNAKPGDRILCALEYMGGDYARRKKELKKLRDNLLHDAISTEALLSHAKSGGHQHLKKMEAKKAGESGFLYVCTSVIYEDFVATVRRFRHDIQLDSMMLQRAGDRLVRTTDSDSYGSESVGIPSPSPAPPVKLVRRKGRKGR